MNSSTHSMYSGKPAGIQTIYVDSGPDFGSKMVIDLLYVHRPPSRPRISWEDAPHSTNFVQPAASPTEEPDHQGLPPLGVPVACDDHEPELVRFVDGADSATRKMALQERVGQQCGKRGRIFLNQSRQGELSVRLDRVAVQAAARSVRSPRRAVVVGIDGIDQCLESPSRRAFQLKMLINVGATVICTVDGRYSDSNLLAFHLRALGIKVILEKLATEGCAKESAAHKNPRNSHATRSVTVGHFPEVHTPSLAACGSKFRQHSAPTETNSFAPREESEKRSEGRQCWRSEDAVHFTSTELERQEYARAYRNEFAMNRLLGEGKQL